MAHDPLLSTFCFAPGIGPVAERKLWKKGVVHWDHATGPLKQAVDDARRDLEAGRPDFARDGLKNTELWRAYPEFRKNCVYLDIETTGLDASSYTTLIGMYDGDQLRILQRGRDLDEFPRLVDRYAMIVTFNGRSFDVPFLRREFPSWRPTQAHWDLRWALRSVGYAGGLKRIEDELGLSRPGPLAGMSGFDAVTLWYAHKRGDPDALPILRRYLAEDVVGLAPLAERAFNFLAEEHPLDVEPLALSERVDCGLDYNPRAIPGLISLL